MTHPVAAIDLGTNTARLLIATTNPYRQLLLKRAITRLGGGFSRASGLSPEAMERSLAALTVFAGELSRHGVTRVRAVATSAVRDAANGRDFCQRVLEKTGIKLEIIDGTEEAVLTLVGVERVIDESRGDLVVFDIGGGSTEYTLARDAAPVFTRSLPLGVVRLTEGKAGAAEMEDKIGRELTILKGELEQEGLASRFAAATLVGTAGTATTLAAIQMRMGDYDYRRVNNLTLLRRDVERIYAQLLPLTPTERLGVAGLEPGREDLIIAGTLVVLQSMQIFGFQALKVSDSGLLEGLILGV
jgi:exopolyphosphatase / guanosine-5'-triphosphate,3'-diphosphate pyrophosphatase